MKSGGGPTKLAEKSSKKQISLEGEEPTVHIKKLRPTKKGQLAQAGSITP